MQEFMNLTVAYFDTFFLNGKTLSTNDHINHPQNQQP